MSGLQGKLNTRGYYQKGYIILIKHSQVSAEGNALPIPARLAHSLSSLQCELGRCQCEFVELNYTCSRRLLGNSIHVFLAATVSGETEWGCSKHVSLCAVLGPGSLAVRVKSQVSKRDTKGLWFGDETAIYKGQDSRSLHSQSALSAEVKQPTCPFWKMFNSAHTNESIHWPNMSKLKGKCAEL